MKGLRSDEVLIYNSSRIKYTGRKMFFSVKLLGKSAMH